MFFSDNLGAVKEASRTEVIICEFCIWARAVEVAATPLVEIWARTAVMPPLERFTVEKAATVAEHFVWTLLIEFKSPVKFRLTEAMVKTGAKEPYPCFFRL